MPLPDSSTLNMAPAPLASWMTDVDSSAAAADAGLDLKAGLASPTFTGLPVAPQWKATGVTGANTTPLTISGANATGAPASGAHVKGEIAGDDTGKLWYCTVAGTPGTWVQIGGAATTIAVEDEGVSTVAAATTLDFVGAGVTVTDAGSGQATVTIPGGSGTFMGCSLTKSASQSIATVSTVAVTFDGEDYDTNTLHDNVTDNTRITIPTGQGGYWMIGGGAMLENMVDGKDIIVRARKNGTTMLNVWNRLTAAAAAGAPGGTFSVVANLAAGDYVELMVYNGDTVSRDVRNTANGGTSLWAYRLPQ